MMRPSCFAISHLRMGKVTPDENISTGELHQTIKDYLATKTHRDMERHVRGLQNISWKTKANRVTRALCGVADFLIPLLAIAPNTQLPRKKLSDAFRAEHEVDPILFTFRDKSLFFDECSVLLRRALCKLRELSESSMLYERALSEAHA